VTNVCSILEAYWHCAWVTIKAAENRNYSEKRNACLVLYMQLYSSGTVHATSNLPSSEWSCSAWYNWSYLWNSMSCRVARGHQSAAVVGLQTSQAVHTSTPWRVLNVCSSQVTAALVTDNCPDR